MLVELVVIGDTSDARVDISPPSSSAVTSPPVAAFISSGPARKMVPCPLTMMVSSERKRNERGLPLHSRDSIRVTRSADGRRVGAPQE